MVTLPSLPSDIIQQFLTHLPPDTSLSSLSLVSTSWLPHARQLDPQFSCIRLRSTNVSSFLTLLHSPLSSFPNHVRELYVDLSLETLPPCAQETIFAILNGPSPARPDIPTTRASGGGSKSILVKVKESVLNIRPPTAKECHILNIVCLFPNLEHLQVQLMGIKSPIPIFDTQPQPRGAGGLKSLSVICNSAPPPPSLKQVGVMPSEWKHFLKWVRVSGVCGGGVRCLYLTCVASWNYEGAEALVKIQGTALQHFHFGPQRSASQYSDLPRAPKILLLSPSLTSLHLSIINTGMSQTAADTLTHIPPRNLTLLGLDIQPALLRDPAELEDLRRLGRALRKRAFARLGCVRVRLEYEVGRGGFFRELVGVLRELFPKRILKVEGVGYERRHLVRDVRDDCFGALG